jgi:hypothetical protein
MLLKMISWCVAGWSVSYSHWSAQPTPSPPPRPPCTCGLKARIAWLGFQAKNDPFWPLLEGRPFMERKVVFWYYSYRYNCKVKEIQLKERWRFCRRLYVCQHQEVDKRWIVSSLKEGPTLNHPFPFNGGGGGGNGRESIGIQAKGKKLAASGMSGRSRGW